MRPGKLRRLAGPPVAAAIALFAIACTGTAPAPTASPRTAGPVTPIDPYGAICSVALSTSVLAGYAPVLFPSSGLSGGAPIADTAVQFLRQTRTRMSRLTEQYPDYASRLSTALDAYEHVLDEVAALPPNVDLPTGLDIRVQDAAGRLEAVGKASVDEVDECPGG